MTGNQPSKRYGSFLQTWKELKPIEASDIEVTAPKPPGELPILPCLYNAIMVENPGHYARVYLTQWYRDYWLWEKENYLKKIRMRLWR